MLSQLCSVTSVSASPTIPHLKPTTWSWPFDLNTDKLCIPPTLWYIYYRLSGIYTCMHKFRKWLMCNSSSHHSVILYKSQYGIFRPPVGAYGERFCPRWGCEYSRWTLYQWGTHIAAQVHCSLCSRPSNHHVDRFWFWLIHALFQVAIF